jgi:hypothetical protein
MDYGVELPVLVRRKPELTPDQKGAALMAVAERSVTYWYNMVALGRCSTLYAMERVDELRKSGREFP